MMMMRLALAILAAIFLTPIQEKFDKTKHPWTRWKEGAYTKMKLTQEMGDNKTEGSMTFKLSKITDKEFTVTNTVEMMGQTQDSDETESYPENGGEETLNVDGKKYECTIWKSKGKKNDQETDSKVWVVKGTDTVIKIVASGGEDVELVAAKMSEELAIGDKKYECIRLEGKLNTKDQEMKTTMWYSPKVPGGMVKAKMEFNAGGQAGSFTMEATEFKGEK